MIIGKVIGNIWATKKDESLNGLKLLVIKPLDYFDDRKESAFVAADFIGAGVGEIVLVAKGSSARKLMKDDDVPIDAAIIGIIDPK